MIAPDLDQDIRFHDARGDVMHFIASVEESCVHPLFSKAELRCHGKMSS